MNPGSVIAEFWVITTIIRKRSCDYENGLGEEGNYEFNMEHEFMLPKGEPDKEVGRRVSDNLQTSQPDSPIEDLLTNTR